MSQRNPEDVLVSRCEGLLESNVDGEVIGLHIDNGTCYGFNETASRIWQLVKRPKSLAEICATLGAEFVVDPATCESDVRALLDDLARDGLVALSVR
jgi:hypothetical protein